MSFSNHFQKFFLTYKFYNQKFLLNPVPYGYGPIFCYWNFQHIYTGSTKAKVNPKKKEFTYSVKWRCFLPIILLGNGCSKHLITEWILTSQHWTTLQKGIKRARQIDFINNNLDSKANIWFYYDVHHAIWLFLNGEFRNTNNL